MKRILLCAVPILLLLAACGSKPTETKQSSSSSSTVESQESSQHQTSTSSSASTETTTETPQTVSGAVNHNGSYYSVEGKYGEVIIVNKKHPLASDYAPGENPEAKAAFSTLQADMIAQGFALSQSYSGFRSYETQAGLYQSYVSQDGQANADRYSARPGYSEHQTGLAFDLIDASGNLLEEPTAAQWLRHHAHEYGFIVRYLPEKEGITGYMAEAWHIRYIGKEATDIYESGLTLEEYYGVPGGDYE
ncbi:LD-carboxypeptidase LdcB/DacB [Streptococcus oriscaviae]|uniref:M15 family metallopeptidase n=1 Tax=Streptococcus oriscaviae TaxID=2781599 RepID=A0ABX7YL16_9STRE|nr:LD-carboxypeptidase LdcB/DacB [Streptococcus oriscaviae]QUE54490.1 M15 family metallopeptidase [Streptococcus oriscaviae]